MILIDKEKFIEEVRKRKYSAASIKLIEEQPEVVAIPIEWIEKWVVTNNVGAGRTIDRLLEDWEKENEI